MSSDPIFDRLSTHRAIAAAPPSEIAWLAAHGALRQLQIGDVLTAKGGTVEGLHIVLGGHMTIHVDSGAGRRKMMEWRGGDVTGLLPYSRLVAPPGDVVAEEPTALVTIDRADLPLLIRECPELTAIFVHAMVDRARHFTSGFLHDEKLVSLGKLAAGLAHELNNPSAAIARSASALAGCLGKAEDAARALGALNLTESQIAVANTVLEQCLRRGARRVLSPLEQEAREDSISAHLKKYGAVTATAEALAETDITFEMLDQLAAAIKGPALSVTLSWLAAACATRSLTAEIQQASSRIHDLVGSVKGFTQMDRAAVAEPVDVEQGLTNTLAVLRAKARAKSAAVNVSVESGLPLVRGFGGELNQVWANLIDNALDAISDGGRVQLSAGRDRETVVVRVIDDGPGIPAEIRDRIFDPFFTTKPVGQGTGLGLDIVRRLVQRNNGVIELDSMPGRTEFRVSLPVVPAAKEPA